MNTTSHSEYLKLVSVLINPVENAFISNNKLENEWEALNYVSLPDFKNAIEEYKAFENILKRHAIRIEYFPLNDLLSIDSIYCRDASIATDFGMIICNMGKDGRALEPNAHEHYFKDQSINILGIITAPGTVEGGDVAWLDKTTLAVGHTYRTNIEGIAQLKALLEPRHISVIVAELPHYKGKQDVFHLMSILSPIDKNLAVVYSPLMPIKFRNELLRRGFDLIEVPDEEFESMGCNVLALESRHCLMVEGNPITKKRLEAAGCIVETYNGTDISVKGGGGPTCLTRPLWRHY
jgi:N-dimethylarginine dimethylaminohydrolase